MGTMNEDIRAATPEEEDDELDGWGPVRVRRSSSIPLPLPSQSPLAAGADDPQSDSEQQPNRNAKLMT